MSCAVESKIVGRRLREVHGTECTWLHCAMCSSDEFSNPGSTWLCKGKTHGEDAGGHLRPWCTVNIAKPSHRKHSAICS